MTDRLERFMSANFPGVTRKSRSAGLVAAAVLVALSGCGGGGGSTSPSPPTQPSAPSTTVSGVAGKGLLLNAIVNFYAVSNGTVGTTPLATVRTDPKTAAFTAQVSSSGPVIVTVTADSSTQMLDELSGAAVAAPTGLVLHAALDGLANLQPIAVTPVTEMSYSLAKAASGGFTVANIDAAANAVDAAFLNGAVALNVQPIDLKTYKTATAAQQELSKLLVALVVAAKEGTATDASGAPCAAADYNQQLVCMVGGLGSLIKLNSSGAGVLTPAANYIQAAYAEIDANTVSVAGGLAPSALGLDLATQAETHFATTAATQAPLPGYDPGASPLANTKALFADVRTNIIDQAATDTFGLAPVATAVANDVKTNVEPTLANVGDVLVAMKTASDMIVAGATDYKGSNSHYCGYDPAGLGTAPNVALCRYGGYDNAMLMTVTQTAVGTYDVKTQPLTGNFYDSQANPVLGGYTPSAASPALDASFAVVTGTGNALTGSATGPIYVTSSGGQVTAALSVAESSDWDASTGTGTLTASGTLSHGNGGISLTSATIAPDSNLVVQDIASVLAGGKLLTLPATPSIQGTLDATVVTSAFSYAAKLTIGAPALDSSGKLALPASVTLSCSIAQVASDGSTTPLFTGEVSVAFQGVPSFDVTQPISDTNFVTAQAQVSGGFVLSGGRLLDVTASVNGSQKVPTPAHPDSLTATYSYSTPSGTALLNATAQYDATDGYTATIANNAGVKATLTKPINGPLTGTVTANGTETASVSGSMINYSDGTTESLY